MSMKQVVVDVAAAAVTMLSSREHTAAPGEPLPVLPAAPGSTPLDPLTCQFGHPNPSGGKFCPDCGLPVGTQVLDMAAIAEPPKPEAALTPEERAVRNAEHQQALAMNAAFASADPPDIEPAGDQNIVIHFVDDGFTALGHVWLRGQQLAIGPEHPRWGDARSWITLTTDQQIERYGKPYFAAGPVKRLESAAEQQHQVEVRRMMSNRKFSAAPDTELLEAR